MRRRLLLIVLGGVYLALMGNAAWAEQVLIKHYKSKKSVSLEGKISFVGLPMLLINPGLPNEEPVPLKISFRDASLYDGVLVKLDGRVLKLKRSYILDVNRIQPLL